MFRGCRSCPCLPSTGKRTKEITYLGIVIVLRRYIRCSTGSYVCAVVVIWSDLLKAKWDGSGQYFYLPRPYCWLRDMPLSCLRQSLNNPATSHDNFLQSSLRSALERKASFSTATWVGRYVLRIDAPR